MSRSARFSEKCPIPPLSVIRLERSDAETPAWDDEVGREFRVGYYSPSDGLDTIWLVDPSGDYCQMIDHEVLAGYFSIVAVSDEEDPFGHERDRIAPLNEPEHLS